MYFVFCSVLASMCQISFIWLLFNNINNTATAAMAQKRYFLFPFFSIFDGFLCWIHFLVFASIHSVQWSSKIALEKKKQFFNIFLSHSHTVPSPIYNAMKENEDDHQRYKKKNSCWITRQKQHFRQKNMKLKKRRKNHFRLELIWTANIFNESLSPYPHLFRHKKSGEGS